MLFLISLGRLALSGAAAKSPRDESPGLRPAA